MSLCIILQYQLIASGSKSIDPDLPVALRVVYYTLLATEYDPARHIHHPQ
jgi:hypothetical protein